MRHRAAPSRAARTALLVVALVLLTWLSLLAARPPSVDWLPPWLGRFGAPESVSAIAVTAAVIVTLSVLSFRSNRGRRSGNVPVVVVAGLAATSAVLGLSSFWHCHDPKHPDFVAPLLWTVSLVKGSVTDFSLGQNHICPDPIPDALWVARLSALGAIFTGLAGIVIALFRSQVDRIHASLARSVTVVIGIDNDTRSMLSAIASTLNLTSTLVIVTGGPDEPGAQEARLHNGRVVSVDMSSPDSLASLSMWRNLERLYLVSPDPTTNQLRLDAITRVLARVGHRQRIPLTVRIDDPWQAEAWRAEQLGGSDTRWAADAVGKYEVTARWLIDSIVENETVQRVFVCGTSELTLALCADLTRRKLENDYYSEPDAADLPALILVGDEAEEYLQDHEFHRGQIGFASTGPTIEATPQSPTVSVLMALIGETDAARHAVIFVDDRTHQQSTARSTGTRLAARFPAMPIYIWDADAQMAQDPLPIIGRLRSYRLALDVPEGKAQDVWERAAELLHQRYIKTNPSPASVPWADLDPFYQGSNRRVVRNALWMVEQIAEHTWNTWGEQPRPLSLEQMDGLTPMQKFERMGFDHDSAMTMAKAEHEDWYDYYRRAKWEYAPVRDDAKRKHNRLIQWPGDDEKTLTEAQRDVVNRTVESLADTLWSLRQLGYRSRPVRQPGTRIGVVSAERPNAPTGPAG